MSKTVWNFAAVTVAVGLVAALTIGQVSVVRADEPIYYVYQATLVGQEGGPPAFYPESGGLSALIHWLAGSGTPQPSETYWGILSSQPKKPPICTCPVLMNGTCKCVWTPPPTP